MKDNPIFSRRGVILGHENFDKWLESFDRGEKVALVSGFMTSGNFHLGSLAVLRQMAYYQKNYNADIFIPIADLEAICVRGTKREDIDDRIVDFLAHFNAAGLDVHKCRIYLQTQNKEVLRRAFEFVSKTSKADMDKLYDRDVTVGEAISSLVQVSDILYPQTMSYGSTLITLGVDEINHFIMTKHMANKLNPGSQHPSITYNRLITGLNGSKMGKSLPENSILLKDDKDSIENKLNLLRRTDIPLDRNAAFNILQWYCDDDRLLEKIDISNMDDGSLGRIVDKSIEVCSDVLEKHQKSYNDFLEEAREILPTLYRG